MSIELSILMPCLNESQTLENCIRKAFAFLKANEILGEVIVADNGSTDGSQMIAERLGARVVDAPVPGYGAALAAGIESAEGTFVIMGDSDGSYDFSNLLPFVEKLREGYDLVMGNRFVGGIAPGAMPFLHRYFGNPFLSWVGRLFFHISSVNDLYCGLRGFRKESIQKLELQSAGMEFALEMVVKSQLRKLRVIEVPTKLVPDGRDRLPHLRRYRDGWRSLRFFFVMSPRWFFGAPGAALMGFGFLVSSMLFLRPIQVGSITFDYHTLAYSATAMVIGYQSLILGAFSKLVSIETSLHPPNTRLGRLRRRGAMEVLILIGLGVWLIAAMLGVIALRGWWSSGFYDIVDHVTIRLVLGSTLLFALGGQTIMAGGLLGFIHILFDRRKREELRGMRSFEDLRLESV